MGEPWRVSVDTGGTFTDVVLQSPDGIRMRRKLLSTGVIRAKVRSVSGNHVTLCMPDGISDDLTGFQVRHGGVTPAFCAVVSCTSDGLVLEDASSLQSGDIIDLTSGESAAVLGIRLATKTPWPVPLPPTELRLGTTRGTNALLEDRHAQVAFFTTRGFADLLRIGNQQRPDIFALPVVLPAPIHACSFEIDERCAADGSVLVPLDADGLRRIAKTALESGCSTAAIALLHAWRNDAHEQHAKSILRACGFEHVSISSELSPTIRIVPRGQAAVIDAAISPIVSSYLEQVRNELHAGARGPDMPDVLVMGSGGGLTPSQRFHAKDALLSGPAGGFVGAVSVARAWGYERVLTIDMGGTSTDVARYDHGFVYTTEQVVGPARLAATALDVHTVAAGGGSVCHVEDGLLAVGPHSGGADPGPACYGRGGPLCLTDINVLAGRLDPHRFAFPIDAEASRVALDAVTDALADGRDADSVLDGLLARADRRMAEAIGRVSLRHGCDPRVYVLVAFGGAGAQHACAVAEALGMEEVLLPAGASVLSAEGIAEAAIERLEIEQILRPLPEVEHELGTLVDEITVRAIAHVVQSGIERASVRQRRVIMRLRLLGQDATIDMDWSSSMDLVAEFHERFAALYGYGPGDRTIEVEGIHVLAGTSQRDRCPVDRPISTPYEGPQRAHRMRCGGQWVEGVHVDRGHLANGDCIEGPALLCDDLTTVVLQPAWSATCGVDGSMLLKHSRGANESRVLDAGAMLERHADAFTAIASDMGEILNRCAISVNVKERLDYSCTLHDPAGRLVVNAPHLPVHLGSMGVCVRRLAEVMEVRPGDVLLTNHPGYGGSHLPDITVVTPVHDDQGVLLGWTASRAHHAEIGGTRPGSMPPDATSLVEEGVVLAPMKIVEGGVSRLDALAERLQSALWPTRSLTDNLADVQAAVAANHGGAKALREIARHTSSSEVIASMQRLQSRSSELARVVVSTLPDERYEASESMDDGTVLAVTIDIQGSQARVDFTGTGAVHAGNLNATDAIVRSVVLYVFRLLVGRRVPLNEGLLEPVDIVLPRCLLNPEWPDDPSECPAVVGGNVETSQRLVDLMLKALNRSAGGQGTMNNMLFGTDAFGYYETLGGGHGAVHGTEGASGVHCHMSNTRITDPEIFEHRFPVRLHRFALRTGSGGAGQYRGGEGLERIIEFLEPVSLSMLTQHRTDGPFGLHGGCAGAVGEQFITRADGAVDVLSSSDARELNAGDRLTIRTPGGGGWGSPKAD
jgi:5-oxoprolinase (ATP-hydrolysing)